MEKSNKKMKVLIAGHGLMLGTAIHSVAAGLRHQEDLGPIMIVNDKGNIRELINSEIENIHEITKAEPFKITRYPLEPLAVNYAVAPKCGRAKRRDRRRKR